MDTGLLSTERNRKPIRPGLAPGTRLSQRLYQGLVREPTLAASSAGFVQTPVLKVWIPSGTPKPQARPHRAGLLDTIAHPDGELQ